MGHRDIVETIHREHQQPVGELLPYSFLSRNVEVCIYENLIVGNLLIVGR